MKTKLAILTVLCCASLWVWAQAVGGSSPAGNPPAGAAGKPPVGAPGNTPNNGINNNSDTMPPFNNGSFQTSTDANSKADGEIKKPGIVKPNTPFYNGGTTN
jgi:hypothetical protein